LFVNVYAGALYLDDCPVERYIPIYLIVGGVFGLFQNISGLVQSVCQQKSSDHENSALSKFCKFSESIIGCFIIAWFIAGEFCLDVALLRRRTYKACRFIFNYNSRTSASIFIAFARLETGMNSLQSHRLLT